MKIVSDKNQSISTQQGLVVGYLLAGYPTGDEFLNIIKDCNKAGLEVYEIGFPSENPYADGEVIHSAHSKVDKKESTSLPYWKKIRTSTEKPIWLMAYKHDFIDSKLYLEFAKNGVMDALVIPDMTCEERIILAEELAAYGVDVLGFVNPGMSKEEMQNCFEHFTLVYAQLHIGQTGVEAKADTYHEMLHVALGYPHARTFAGFGINNAQRVKKLHSEGFHGAIIGTSMIKKLNVSKEEMLDFVRELQLI